MKALILAGGDGKRFGNLSQTHNKCMTVIGGKHLIEYGLDLAVQSNVSEIVILVGHKSDEIIATYRDGYKGKPIKYAFQPERRGLVHAIECSKDAIGKDDFILMLGDELLVNPRHKRMIEEYGEDKAFAICGIMKVKDSNMITRNYEVFFKKENIIGDLIEKPENPKTNIMGTGNCIFKNEILSYIEKTPINPKRGERELVDLIKCAINDGQIVKAFDICDGYVNVNFEDDIKKAESEIIK
jgi:dTDP-glucose pyrophosphorylase